jgi:disulfide bond formation protein DsbB
MPMRQLYTRPAGTAPLAVMAGVSVAAVGAALISQHVFDMQPCPWCVLQRLIFLVLAAFALLGVAWRGRLGQRLAAAGVLASSLAGVAAALWQHFVASSSASCNLTLADRVMSATTLDARWPEVFAAYASCADAAVRLFGLPYEFWSLALYGALGGAAAWLLLKRLR